MCWALCKREKKVRKRRSRAGNVEAIKPRPLAVIRNRRLNSLALLDPLRSVQFRGRTTRNTQGVCGTAPTQPQDESVVRLRDQLREVAAACRLVVLADASCPGRPVLRVSIRGLRGITFVPEHTQQPRPCLLSRHHHRPADRVSLVQRRAAVVRSRSPTRIHTGTRRHSRKQHGTPHCPPLPASIHAST